MLKEHREEQILNKMLYRLWDQLSCNVLLKVECLEYQTKCYITGYQWNNGWSGKEDALPQMHSSNGQIPCPNH